MQISCGMEKGARNIDTEELTLVEDRATGHLAG
jgi:hypothetical protein